MKKIPQILSVFGILVILIFISCNFFSISEEKNTIDRDESTTPTTAPTEIPTPATETVPPETDTPTPETETPTPVPETLSLPYYENFESGFGFWINIDYDDYDWTLHQGATSSNHTTGPYIDHTTKSTIGYFAYMKNSYGACSTDGKFICIESPLINADSQDKLYFSFYYHMFGINIGSLNIDIFTDHWEESIWSVTGPQHEMSDDYSQAILDLSSYTGLIKIRMRAVAAGGSKGNIAIDDLLISETMPQPLQSTPIPQCLPIVKFPDAGLDSAIRSALRKPEGDIYSCELKNITILLALKSGISDLSGIEELTSLTTLRLSDNSISDLSPLSNLVSLETLLIDKNKITDISPLSNLGNLSYLALDYNRISDVKAINSLKKLDTLLLGDNQIEVLHLSHLPNLTRMNCDSNMLREVEFIDLPILRELHLSLNRIENFEGLIGLSALEILWINNNRISDIGPLKNLTNIYYLTLHNNLISDLEPLENLILLRTLILSYNQVSDISPLSSLENIWQLYLDSNDIINIDSLGFMKKLSFVDLQHNFIKDISALKELTEIIDIDLEDNQISDILPIVESTDIRDYCRINLKSNPLSEDSINIYIPALKERHMTISY